MAFTPTARPALSKRCDRHVGTAVRLAKRGATARMAGGRIVCLHMLLNLQLLVACVCIIVSEAAQRQLNTFTRPAGTLALPRRRACTHTLHTIASTRTVSLLPRVSPVADPPSTPRSTRPRRGYVCVCVNASICHIMRAGLVTIWVLQGGSGM